MNLERFVEQLETEEQTEYDALVAESQNGGDAKAIRSRLAWLLEYWNGWINSLIQDPSSVNSVSCMLPLNRRHPRNPLKCCPLNPILKRWFNPSVYSQPSEVSDLSSAAKRICRLFGFGRVSSEMEKQIGQRIQQLQILSN